MIYKIGYQKRGTGIPLFGVSKPRTVVKPRTGITHTIIVINLLPYISSS